MEIRLDGVLRNAEQDRNLADAGAQPIVQPQSGLVDLWQLVDAFGEGAVPLRVRQLFMCVGLRRCRRSERLVADVRCAVTHARLEVERLVERDAVDP